MALLTTLEHSSGLTIENSYARITRYLGDKDAVEIFVSWYADEAARLAGKSHLQEKTYLTPLPYGDILPGLYAFLKTLPEFAGAIDV